MHTVKRRKSPFIQTYRPRPLWSDTTRVLTMATCHKVTSGERD